MKKTLLTAGLIALTFGAFAQFTADKLVVSQYGDGAAALTTKTLPVFLKQYDIVVSANPSLSIAMPTAASGANFPFTGLSAGSNEGLISLSADGASLAMFGYGVAVDAAAVAATDPRTMAIVDAAGTVNTSTTQVGSATTLVGPRSAATNGVGFWTCSSVGGIYYTVLGASTSTSIAATPGPIRSLSIYNGQLYEVTNSNSPASLHVATVGTGLPVTTSTLTALPGLEGSTTVAPITPNQAVFLKTTAGVGAPNVVYITSDIASAGKIEKYVFNGTTWVGMGTVTVSTATAALSVKGITARIIAGVAYIYANTATSIISIQDAAPFTSTITDVANPVTILASAPANTLFKGIAFTPGTNVLPIKLSSFTGKSELNGAQLSWTTSSEKNNNHFEVLRSTDGTQFSKIGQVAGSGNSDAALNYSFLDRNAAIGANYYKLNQVDNNGTSEEFGPVVVTLNGQAAAISVYANKASGQINVNVFANKGGEGVLNVYDAGGKVVANQKVSLQAGNNQISLNSQNAGAGLHIASLTFAGETLTKKFIFQ